MALTTIDLSTITVSLIRSLSCAFFLCGYLSAPSLANTENPPCIQKNGQRNNCIKIVKTTVIEDLITLIIRARQANGRTINNIDPKKFTLIVDGVKLASSATNWQKPEGSPSPARVVMLLDYSASMIAKDSRGSSKIEGAIKGIETFVDKLSKSNGNIKVSIVPFAYPKQQECQKYPIADWLLRSGHVNNQQILSNFFAPGTKELRDYLNFLRQQPLCPATATNLYDALALTLDFLADRQNDQFYPPPSSNLPKPGLFIILLSDGFNSVPFDPLYSDLGKVEDRCNPAHFRKLQYEYLLPEKYAEITIYTLGYGLTPQELGRRYNLNRPARCEDLSFDPKKENLPVPAKDFVDQEALQKIAKLKNGFFDLSGYADGIAQIFANFRDSILGEYQVSYKQPNADRSSQHQVQVVIPFGNQLLSDTEEYTIRGIGGFSLPVPVRFTILISAITLISTFGVIPFFFWARKLKNKG